MSKFDEILNSSNVSDALLGEQIDKCNENIASICPNNDIRIEYAEIGSGKSLTYENIKFAIINFGRYTTDNISLNSTYGNANSSICHIKAPSYMAITSSKEGTFTITNNASLTVQGIVIYSPIRK